MYINPIHAGPVALALVLAARAHSQGRESGREASSVAAQRSRRFRPLQPLAQWWRQLDEVQDDSADSVQLLALAECWGRPHANALGVFLLLMRVRRERRLNRAEAET